MKRTNPPARSTPRPICTNPPTSTAAIATARSPPTATSAEANTTVIGPVGPEICMRVPPSSAATKPSTIAP